MYYGQEAIVTTLPIYIVSILIQNHKHAHTDSDIKHSDGGREERNEERRDGRKDGRNVGWMKRSEDGRIKKIHNVRIELSFRHLY